MSISKNSVEYKLAAHFYKQGYKVQLTKPDEDGSLNILLEKDGRRRIIRCQYYPQNNDVYMGNFVRALAGGTVGNFYCITDETGPDNAIHKQVIHLLKNPPKSEWRKIRQMYLV